MHGFQGVNRTNKGDGALQLHANETHENSLSAFASAFSPENDLENTEVVKVKHNHFLNNDTWGIDLQVYSANKSKKAPVLTMH